MKSKVTRSMLAVLLVISFTLAVSSCASTTTVTPTSAGTTAGGQTTPMTTVEKDTKPVKIRFFRVAVEQDPKKDRTLIELQKRTNTDLEFVTAPWDQVATKIMTMLSSGEKLDVMSIDPGQVNYIQMAQDGLILKLDDLLKTDKYPIAKKLAYGDAYYKKYNIYQKVYGIPLPIQPSDWNHIIRSDWLKAVGLEMPKTPEDMYEVLKRFKNNDPDKNGKDDTLGVYLAPVSGFNAIFNMFMNVSVTFDEIDGKIVYNYSSSKFKKALQYTQKLYAEGLINKDFATIKDKNYVLNQFSAGLSGIANSPMVIRTFNALKQTVPNATIELLNPLPHDSGSNGANAVDSKWNWMVSVLPKTCSNPDKVLSFLEYCNSEEGRKLICVGIEGIHYKSYKDGVFYGISAEEQGKDWDPAKGEGPTGSPMWWGMTSTINGIIPFSKYDSVMEALKNVTTFVSEEDLKTNPYWDMRKLGSKTIYHDPVPVIIPEMQEIGGSITTIRDEFQARMIMSDSSKFEELWSEYLTRLDKAGLQKAVDAAAKWYAANK